MSLELLPTYSEKVLNDFATQQWGKALAYLQKSFTALSEDDCMDVFQESFISLHENNQKGKLEELTSSLSTYFISICRNKAFEALRAKGKHLTVDTETSLTLMSGDIKEDKINAILDTFDNEESVEERKEELIRKIVKDLPSPCNELLWGFYRDGHSMQTLAQMFNYSLGSVKVTKHRCTEKFRKRYSELINSIY